MFNSDAGQQITEQQPTTDRDTSGHGRGMWSYISVVSTFSSASSCSWKEGEGGGLGRKGKGWGWGWVVAEWCAPPRDGSVTREVSKHRQAGWPNRIKCCSGSLTVLSGAAEPGGPQATFREG